MGERKFQALAASAAKQKEERDGARSSTVRVQQQEEKPWQGPVIEEVEEEEDDGLPSLESGSDSNATSKKEVNEDFMRTIEKLVQQEIKAQNAEERGESETSRRTGTGRTVPEDKDLELETLEVGGGRQLRHAGGIARDVHTEEDLCAGAKGGVLQPRECDRRSTRTCRSSTWVPLRMGRWT